MQVIRGEEAEALGLQPPEGQDAIRVHWWADPPDDSVLHVGMASVAPGGATPPHVHIGGQVMVVVSGRGFVETDGRREELVPGDVVIAAPGELHVHGAAADSPLAHLTVTTGGYRFPGGDPRPDD